MTSFRSTGTIGKIWTGCSSCWDRLVRDISKSLGQCHVLPCTNDDQFCPNKRQFCPLERKRFTNCSI
eukprot:6180488-Pleurochrysis_carterae.AAC.4